MRRALWMMTAIAGAQLAIKPADIQRAAKATLVRANSVVLMTQPAAGGAAPAGRKGGR
jgi:hypothetical protein